MRSWLAALAVAAVACRGDQRPAFDRAAAAIDRADFHEAAKLYAQVKTPEAELRLANIEWRAFEEVPAARARLARLAGTEKALDAQLELARIARLRREWADAYRLAQAAEKIAKTKDDRRRVMMAKARVVIEEAMRTRPAQLDRVHETIGVLRNAIAIEGPRLEAALLLVRGGVLANDRSAIVEGARAYYHVSATAPPPHLIAGAFADLATASDDAALARALAGIRFFPEAALVAPKGSDIARYAAMLGRIETIANEHYRQIVLGNENGRALRKNIEAELRTMWPALDFDEAVKEMGTRYGGYLLLGKTGGHQDTHLAHKVIDRAFEVEQYGRKAAVRFIALDGVVSNGFQTWRTDGRSGDGGWGTHEQIVQVRPLYADGPLRTWLGYIDPEASAKYRDEAAAQTMEGLAKRLRVQYLDRVHAETKTREAFLARLEADEFHYSIVLHEGRHAIDALSGDDFKVWELEYRAKLSQIALSDAPRLALAAVVEDTIGGDSPHGIANEKLIGELTRKRPSVPFDAWSDDEIRAACRSLDPFATR
ncbi:MAG TPA: hypothetical protein VE010_00570 [Thermoanaerobaculia bacterium]|nr:hypothetical protein [Thermoanaerobaculia bacterium]